MTQIFLFLLVTIQPASPDTELQTVAKAFVERLNKGEFDAAVKDFDATMTKVMSPAQLKTTWQTVISQAGAYQKQLGVRTEAVGKYRVVMVTCQFAQAKLNARVVFDGEKHIAGLGFLPAVEYKPPAYANRQAFSE